LVKYNDTTRLLIPPLMSFLQLQRASGDAVRKRIMAHRSGLQSVALAGCQGDRSLQQFSAANHSPRPPEFHAQ
jgi:hypothetical protein